jgi:hypothetical protein
MTLRCRGYLTESKGPSFKKKKMKMAIKPRHKKKMKPGEEYVDTMALGSVGYHKRGSGWVVSHIKTGMRVGEFDSRRAARLFAQYVAKILPDIDDADRAVRASQSHLRTIKDYKSYLIFDGKLPYQEWEQASRPRRDKPGKGSILFGH